MFGIMEMENSEIKYYTETTDQKRNIIQKKKKNGNKKMGRELQNSFIFDFLAS